MGGIEISAVSVSFLLLIPFQVLAMDFGAGAVLQSVWGDASSHPTTLVLQIRVRDQRGPAPGGLAPSPPPGTLVV